MRHRQNASELSCQSAFASTPILFNYLYGRSQIERGLLAVYGGQLRQTTNGQAALFVVGDEPCATISSCAISAAECSPNFSIVCWR